AAVAIVTATTNGNVAAAKTARERRCMWAYLTCDWQTRRMTNDEAPGKGFPETSRLIPSLRRAQRGTHRPRSVVQPLRGANLVTRRPGRARPCPAGAATAPPSQRSH